jgi:hypothetical protein
MLTTGYQRKEKSEMQLKLPCKLDTLISIVLTSTAMKMKSDKELKIGEVIERRFG